MNPKLILWSAFLGVYVVAGAAFADDRCADCHGAPCSSAAPVVALTYPTGDPIAAPPQPVEPAPWWARWLPPPRRRPAPPPPRRRPVPPPRPAVPPPRW